MVLLDTSVLVASLTGSRLQAVHLRQLALGGEKLAISALVLYEWRCGPRTDAELCDQEILLPASAAIPFSSAQAQMSATLYRTLPRSRARIMDFGIAACALEQGAPLWTLNRIDFDDIPGLRLFDPAL